jgi:hypothetical protein
MIVRGVTKKDQIRVSQPYRLGERVESAASPGEPKARVLQQNDESAVIEVTCECGKRVFLTCRFDQ